MWNKVLLVDDEATDIEALRNAVRPYSQFEAETANSASQAIRLLEKSPGNYAAVFLDLSLPGAPGSEVLRHVRRENLITPVVVITGSEAAADIYAIYRGGANAYVVKSPDRDQYQTDLNAAAKFWLGINRLPRFDSMAQVDDVLGPPPTFK